MTQEDRHMTYEQIQGTLEIGMTDIPTILRDELGVRKLVSRWVHHALIEE